MKLLAPAKINLYLNILNKRKDGYHTLKTIFQTVSLYDRIEIEKSKSGDRIHLNVLTQESPCPTGPENIVWKAADLFFKKFRLKEGCKITLKKEIPTQAGLGGGSSDAATTLQGLAKLFLGDEANSSKTRPILHQIAKGLGADVPFFLKGGCAIASGIGDRLTPLSTVPHFWAVIIKPSIGCSTVEAYRWLDSCPRLTPLGDFNRMVTQIRSKKKISYWGPYIYNSFEGVVFKKYPEIGEIKSKLIEAGSEFVSLSGSGSALFGIVSTRKIGQQVMDKCARFHKKIWLVSSLT